MRFGFALKILMMARTSSNSASSTAVWVKRRSDAVSESSTQHKSRSSFLLWRSLKPLFNRSRNNRVYSVAQRRDIFLTEILCFNHVMQNHGDSARPEQPACFLVERV